MEFDISNDVIIVTGATKGMGLATTTKLLECNAKVVMVYASDRKNASNVYNSFAEFQDNILMLQADITNSSSRESIIKETLDKFGKINALVNNAGVPAKASFLKEVPEDFDRVIDVNLKAQIFLAQLVAKQLISQGVGGSIVNFSSVSGHRGMGGIAYDAAKAGIIIATQTMANTLGKHNIRVNSISPGTHRTEMNRHHWENKTELHQKMIGVTALGRSADAMEIAGTVLYLVSNQSSYTTGIDIVVDGGYLSHCPGRK